MRSGPVHTWFGLTYSSYLVLQRSLMEGMPEEWQTRMVALLEEMAETYDTEAIGGTYNVNLRGRDGSFKRDPYANYRRPPQLPYRKKEA